MPLATACVRVDRASHSPSVLLEQANAAICSVGMRTECRELWRGLLVPHKIVPRISPLQCNIL